MPALQSEKEILKKERSYCGASMVVPVLITSESSGSPLTEMSDSFIDGLEFTGAATTLSFSKGGATAPVDSRSLSLTFPCGVMSFSVIFRMDWLDCEFWLGAL
jgi:hypothetical protein